MFRPVTNVRAPASSRFAELFLLPGPERIGVTGDNSYAVMYGYDWLLVWDRDDGLLHLWQERDGAWVEVVEDLPPVFASPAPVGSRRWSLAFDQSARVILAYEDATGIVRVTRWDPSSNGYVQNVTFAGADPCVVIDASWSFSIPGSDVLLFHLSPDRERLYCRVQRDVYATEYLIWDFGSPVVLDRVLALPYRFQVLAADATGVPLPEVLVSAWYPVPSFVRVSGDGVVLSGAYDKVAEALAHTLAVEGDGVIASGLYEAPFSGIRHDLLVVGDGVIQSGAYRNVVTTYLHSLAVEGDAYIHSGVYADIATQITHSVTVEGDGQIIGGSYATP